MAALWLFPFATQPYAEVLTFGIVPHLSAARLAATWGPLLEAAGTEAGIVLDFRTAPDIPEFYRRLRRGEYDVAYMNPYQYVAARRDMAFTAMAREKGKKIQGVIVVRTDSPIRDIDGLADRSLAFPSPQSFAASVLPQAALRSKGIAVTPTYVSSHESVYLGVAEGLFPAGGGIMRTLDALPPDLRGQLHVLWRTETFTPHAIAVHPRVSAETVSRLVAAMVALSDTEQGLTLLSAIGFNGIEAARDSDWDDIRALGITPADAGGL